MSDPLARRLIEAAHRAIAAHADELTALDGAIGDGDHGVNMRRGFDALAAAETAAAGGATPPFAQALRDAGTTLVMTVGGAAGPLYGSFLLAVGAAAAARPLQSLPDAAAALEAGVAALRARGKVERGAKTLLDVLEPAVAAFAEAAEADAPLADALTAARRAAELGLAATAAMRAAKGRAAYLGDRSVGHLDPGARSAALLVGAVCDVFEGKGGGPSAGEVDSVSIVIVSQSPDVARGVREMVLQMVGDSVRVAACGGAVDGGLGTDVGAIMRAIEAVATPRGVAVLVDLGGAETSAEMAIEMLSATRDLAVAICNAPLVEGAVMAATEAAGGASLARVRAAAEDCRS